MEGSAAPPVPFDVAIVGAGVSGANIARALSAFRLSVALLERGADVSFGTSKANSGIVHGGFHHHRKFLKTRLELEGGRMFDRLQRELGFPFRRCGILVAALHEDEMKSVGQLYRQGLENGVPGLELCSRERMLELEPKLSYDVVGGLFAPGGGIVEPYRFVFSLVESAMRNGVELLLNFRLDGGAWDGARALWTLHSGDGRAVEARFVVNAAGLFADEVSRSLGAESFDIRPRKGEYYLLDRETRARPSRVIFPVPAPNSKGMLVIPTVEGTVLVGPTADDVSDKQDLSTSLSRLEFILESAKKLVPFIARNDVITSFAGLRPALGDDFLIEPSRAVPHLVQVAGIQSPGLTASPAIGRYVTEILAGLGLALNAKPDWNPTLPERQRARDLSPEALDALIAQDPAWGNIICRCECVSEAEIVEAIRLGHRTLDGIKFFTRAQMGRCQGGFCGYKLIKLIQRETGQSWDAVTKHGGESRVLGGEV